MKTETIKAIFTNLLFVIGVILVIVGASRGVLTTTRIVVFEKYPLNAYEETRCEVDSAYPRLVPGESEPVNNDESKTIKENCLSILEHERKVRLTDDIVNSITLIVSGAVLVMAFRKFIFK